MEGASNRTVLVYNKDASNYFDRNEDAMKLFYENQEDKPQIIFYSLTPDQTPLAINSSGDLTDQEIKLGMRYNKGGELNLSFKGLDTFGHKVYLLDGDTEIDLETNPIYTTSVENTNGFTELNDRFKLIFTPKEITGMENYSKNEIMISSKDGIISVSSGQNIQTIEVISVSGVVLQKEVVNSTHYSFDVNKEIHSCILKIISKDNVEVRKIIIK